MKVLITGNLGYVGPGLVKEFRKFHPEATLVGFDIGYFAKHLTNNSISPESYLDMQYYGDVRKFPEEILEGVDTVVSLAAISNDPIGNQFEEVTMDINYRANVNIAALAKKHGVKKFIFASSCSVYGAASDGARTEESELNPLTAYAKSKIYSENDLAPLADSNFQITCHRFATACGMSERLRLDLVLNDFVAGALTSGEISILSDGTPWRPLINVLDMARAIRWSHNRDASAGDFLVVNTGSNVWNYQVKELAMAVQEILPEVQVSVNENAAPDKRSYRVNFDKFAAIAPDHQPQYDLKTSVQGLVDGLRGIGFGNADFRNSMLMRLNVIRDLLAKGQVDNQLSLVV
ncbi:MAG: NAD-dependent epimerase/dehydratase family protein [Bacteroidia bacterium]